MKYADRPTQMHLKHDDLCGIGASLRTIFTVADDGRFDALLRDLDLVSTRVDPASPQANGRSRDRWLR